MTHSNILNLGDPVQQFVRKTISKYLQHHKRIPSEMKAALKNSEHIKNLERRLVIQIKDVQILQTTRGRNKIKQVTFRSMIIDVVELFIVGFEGHANRRRQSVIKQYETDHAGDDVKEMESTLQGKSTGVFEDMGLVIPDEQQEKTENHIKEPVKHGILVDYGRGQRDKTASKDGASD